MNTTETVSWKDLLVEAVGGSIRPVVKHSGDVVCVVGCGPMTFAWADRGALEHGA